MIKNVLCNINKNGSVRHFHGREARGKKLFCFFLHIIHTDHNGMSGLKDEQNSFSTSTSA